MNIGRDPSGLFGGQLSRFVGGHRLGDEPGELRNRPFAGQNLVVVLGRSFALAAVAYDAVPLIKTFPGSRISTQQRRRSHDPRDEVAQFMNNFQASDRASYRIVVLQFEPLFAPDECRFNVPAYYTRACSRKGVELDEISHSTYKSAELFPQIREIPGQTMDGDFFSGDAGYG